MTWGTHKCSNCESRFHTQQVYVRRSYGDKNSGWTQRYEPIGWYCSKCGRIET